MNCYYCGNPAIKVNIIETRGGAGTTVEKTYVCKVHSGRNAGATCNVRVLQFQYDGANMDYSNVGHTHG